jgi:hypothetical protein
MYLIDDVVTYTPQDDHKIAQSINVHTYLREGVVRNILETVDGSMYYDVEVYVPSNGSYHLASIPEEDLAYAGMHVPYRWLHLEPQVH